MRTRRKFECRPPMCHECEGAMKAISRIGYVFDKQGEQHNALSPNANKSVELGIEASDSTIKLANIIVEIDDGCVECIKINDDESAEEVAKKVCRKNDIPDQFVALLAEHIIDRYPKRHVDKKKEEVIVNKKKEEVTINNNECQESKLVESQSESSNSHESKKK